MSLLHREIGYFLIDQDGVSLNAGESIAIREPKKFDDIQIILQRDKEFFGVIYEFSDGEVNLIFGGESEGTKSKGTKTGITLIETVYEIKGVDGNILFQIKEDTTLLYEGNLNFKKYVRDFFSISIPVKSISFEEKVRSRFDVEVDMISTTGMDGQSSSAATVSPVYLRPPRVLNGLDVLARKATLDSGFLTTTNRVIIYLCFYESDQADLIFFNYAEGEDGTTIGGGKSWRSEQP